MREQSCAVRDFAIFRDFFAFFSRKIAIFAKIVILAKNRDVSLIFRDFRDFRANGTLLLALRASRLKSGCKILVTKIA